MKQLGNLAVICAKRADVILLVKNGVVSVVVNHINGVGTRTFDAAWDDDAAIGAICRELNFGESAGGAAT